MLFMPPPLRNPVFWIRVAAEVFQALKAILELWTGSKSH